MRRGPSVVTKLEAAGLVAEIAATHPHADVPSGAGPFTAKVTGPVDRIVRLLSDGPQLSGSVQLDASGSLGVRPDFDVKLQAPSLTFTGTDKKSFTGEVTASAQGAYDPATGAVEVKNLTATGPGATFAGTVMFRPGQSAKFDVRSDVTMAEASPILAFVAPSIQAAAREPCARRASSRSSRERRADASRASFDLTLDRLKMDMFDLENVGVDAVLEGGIARTKKASANLNGGTAQLDATIDLRPEVPEWKGNANLERVQITKEMQPAIARAIPIFAGIVRHRERAASGPSSTSPAAARTGRRRSRPSRAPALLGLAGTRLSQSEILAAVGSSSAFRATSRSRTSRRASRSRTARCARTGWCSARRRSTSGWPARRASRAASTTTSASSRRAGVTAQWKKLKPVLDRDGFLPFRLQGDVTHPSPKLPKMEDLLGGAVDDLLKGGLEDLLKKKKKKLIALGPERT